MLLGIVLVAFTFWFLSRVIQDARQNAWTGPRSSAMRSRSVAPKVTSGRQKALNTAGRSLGSLAAHPGSRMLRAQATADAHRAWQETFATDWLEQRRHDRTNGTAAAAPARPTLRQRLRLAPFTPDPASPANGGSSGAAPAAITPPPPPAKGPSPPPPAQKTPAPSTNGGSPVATSTAPAEQLTEAVNAIYAHAASGGLNAKQEAVKAAHAAATRFAGMCQMLARTMSEPGSNYGPEVTEPIATAGTNFQAGAMSLSEADASLETLGNMTLREAAQSPRQTPHHANELSESGRH